MPDFRILFSFVLVYYTSNMAACYDNDVDDVTAPRVQVQPTSCGPWVKSMTDLVRR